MKSSVLIRTSSIGAVRSPAVRSPAVSGSPRAALSRSNSLSGEKTTAATSPRICLKFDVNRRGDRDNIGRALSESNILRSDSGKPRIGRSPGSGSPEEVMEFPGGDYASKTAAMEREERRKMGAYYQEMLKANPSDPLLLRNYGQFLHEVEKDTVRAEEYYCRAILASPGDGEVLSLYGKLIWESQRDKDRAKSYFNRAVSAAPDNCMVLGSFASFMWEAEEEEEEDEELNSNTTAQVSSGVQRVPAF